MNKELNRIVCTLMRLKNAAFYFYFPDILIQVKDLFSGILSMYQL